MMKSTNRARTSRIAMGMRVHGSRYGNRRARSSRCRFETIPSSAPRLALADSGSPSIAARALALSPAPESDAMRSTSHPAGVDGRVGEGTDSCCVAGAGRGAARGTAGLDAIVAGAAASLARAASFESARSGTTIVGIIAAVGIDWGDTGKKDGDVRSFALSAWRVPTFGVAGDEVWAGLAISLDAAGRYTMIHAPSASAARPTTPSSTSVRM